MSILPYFGCYIDPNEPPPKGYRCNCQYFLDCWGDAEQCIDNRFDPECSGCYTEDCCTESGYLGNCNGYGICTDDFCDRKPEYCEHCDNED